MLEQSTEMIVKLLLNSRLTWLIFIKLLKITTQLKTLKY